MPTESTRLGRDVDAFFGMQRLSEKDDRFQGTLFASSRDRDVPLDHRRHEKVHQEEMTS